jgi:hypothetical protein
MYGTPVWNRTTIPGFVDQCIIHYTTGVLNLTLAGPVGIEPTPTVSKTAMISISPKPEWCPWRDSNPHTPPYLDGAMTRYKLVSLPLSYRGKLGVSGETRTPTNGFGDRSTAIILPRHKNEFAYRYTISKSCAEPGM